jgi:hypothetical protein
MGKVYEVWVNEVRSGKIYIRAENEDEARAKFYRGDTGREPIDWYDDEEVRVVQVREADDDLQDMVN